jgi:hypothetical protein
MRLKLPLLAAFVAVVAVVSVTAATATAASPSRGSFVTSAAGTTEGTISQSVTGNFTITGFKRVNDIVYAVGTFTGSVNGGPTQTDPTAYAQVTSVDNHSLTGSATSAPAAQQATSCQILSLTLGPLHLDLLGLVVDLNQVNLQISAEPGSGNLLGNLLCSVAHLLDNTGGATGGLSGLLQQLTSLLNQILAAL